MKIKNIITINFISLSLSLHKVLQIGIYIDGKFRKWSVNDGFEYICLDGNCGRHWRLR
jgi:hypothetical protein